MSIYEVLLIGIMGFGLGVTCTLVFLVVASHIDWKMRNGGRDD